MDIIWFTWGTVMTWIFGIYLLTQDKADAPEDDDERRAG